MANIPGILGYIQPTTVSRVRTVSRAVSIPGGLRILAVVGEGLREEVIIDSAAGDGTDGFNPTFTAESDGYGRFFRASNYPIISNRSELYLNGSALSILEGTVDGSSFSTEYDAKLEIATGKIELQGASLIDQGGAYYLANSSNSGDGYLSDITLADTNAPAETWTVRCTDTLKDSYGAPIRGQASFLVSGSVSGQLLDEYGQPYIWKSDGIAMSNGILSFAIHNISPSAVFQVGDRFSIGVQSRVLQINDNLELRYIASADVNDPEAFTDPVQLFAKHGSPSSTNTLSLAAQMAFENGATSVLALQAKPPLPRKITDIVLPAYSATGGTSGASGNSDPDDLIFYIDDNGKPDTDTQVQFFVIGTDGTETQIFPNKVDFYDPDITQAFAQYEDSGVSTNLLAEFMDPGQSGYTYSYTVVSDDKIEQGSNDATIAPIGIGDSATVTAASAQFVAADVGKYLDFHNTSTANSGRYQISAVASATSVTITRASGSFVSESSVRWQLLASSGTSQRILFTTDLALTAQKGLKVMYTDEDDADFYDANWADALDALETQDLQILTMFPTQTFSAIQQAGRVHCERMSSSYYKRERVLITGALEGLTVANVTGQSLAAPEDIGVLEGIQGDDASEVLAGNIEDLADYGVSNSFGDSFRVIYMYPDSIVRVINGTRSTLPGYYIAAAAGGYLAGEANIAMPLTFKTLVGFTILNSKVYKQEELNSLGDNGITVVQPVTGGGRVLHGKTTTQSGYAEEEEISIVFIRDQVARTMRTSFQAFIGKPETDTLAPSLTARAISLLNAFVSQNLITAYRNLSVARDETEARQWNIVVEVQPNFPVNWIFIDVSVGLF